VDDAGRVLVIACGALSWEITALKRANGWDALEVTCLPPELHNRPEQIPAAVEQAIAAARADGYRQILVGYADCGTGGLLDRVLEVEKVERLPGAHCYEFYATSRVFAQLQDAEPGTFYLTDFLVRHYERLVFEGLGLDRYPQLMSEYFRHYTRIVYLSQLTDDTLRIKAEAIAEQLKLRLEVVPTGYGELGSSIGQALTGIGVVVESLPGAAH
jgi:Protein of unknown function (DUF1638)